MAWIAIEMLDCVQIYPDYELGHILDLDCWCSPGVSNDDLPVITHKDLAEREGFGPDAWLI